MSACEACGTDLVPGANFCFKCGARQGASPVEDPLVGRSLGAYRILAPLGQGGMGKVYRAEQANLGRPVCIKTLLPQYSRDPTLTQRFAREAQSISALRHPNIVGVLDFGRAEDGTLYLAMEFIEGRSLRAVIDQESPLPLDRCLGIADQILSALAEAHGASIIHRDLKPENVLVSRLRDGSDLVKVVDFGIAKLATSDKGQKLTGTGMAIGTPGYMAPEQIAGDPLDVRADVYSAGVLMFELLTGQAPFPVATLQEMLQAQLAGAVPPPSAQAAMPIPSTVDLLVLRAMARDREQRFGSALEMKQVLSSVRASLRGERSTHQAAGQIACPACGRLEARDRKFCGDCGAPLAAAPSPAGPAPSAVATAPGVSTQDGLAQLREFTPQRLLDHLVDLQQSLAGERRDVAVLFGDISGFTSMSETMDPEEVRAVMNRCFEGMVEAVQRYDGTVDKFIGDCIMVLFGAPRAHEDDPERAVRCALEMLRYLGEVNKTLSRPLGMRIGINAGEVIAGGVGGHGRMDYTVMGDVVNTAQRLESNARVNHVLVSRAVCERARAAIEFAELPPIKVKGKKEPLPVFEVVGLKAQAEAAPSTPMVGRAEELRTLEVLLERARAGTAGAALILGEAGMGKTRLAAEAARLASGLGLQVVAASAGRFGRPGPLELVRDAVFGLCGGKPRSAGEADERLTGLKALGLGDGELGRLRHLFGTGVAVPGFDAEEARRLDHAAALEPFERACRREGGLCLVLEDLHLADAVSLGLLQDLLARNPGQRLSIVGTARPGESERLLPGAARLELGALGRGEILRLAGAQLGGEVPAAACETLLQKAEGNPLFALELVRRMIEAGALELSGGVWRAQPTLFSLNLPDTIHLLVGARLDQLAPAAKALLRRAAVAGAVFTMEEVGAALDPGTDAAAGLAECLHRGFLEQADLPGALRFKQSAVRDAVLQNMAKADVRHIHLRLAEALERGAGGTLESTADRLAHHFLAAEQPRKATRYLMAAADALSGKSDHGGAAERYLTALGILEKELGERLATPDDAARLLKVATRAAAASLVVAPDQALATADRALARAAPDCAHALRAELLQQRGNALLRLSRPAEAQAAFAEALRLATGRVDPFVLSGLHADLAAALEAQGDLNGAADRLTEGLHLCAGRSGAQGALWPYLNQLGRLQLRLGRADKARTYFENARTQAAQARSALGESRALSNLASAMSAAGDHRPALTLVEQALALATQAGDRVGVARLHYNAGRILLALGDAAQGQARLQRSYQDSSRLGWREGIAAAAQALDALKARRAR